MCDSSFACQTCAARGPRAQCRLRPYTLAAAHHAVGAPRSWYCTASSRLFWGARGPAGRTSGTRCGRCPSSWTCRRRARTPWGANTHTRAHTRPHTHSVLLPHKGEAGSAYCTCSCSWCKARRKGTRITPFPPERTHNTPAPRRLTTQPPTSYNHTNHVTPPLGCQAEEGPQVLGARRGGAPVALHAAL